MTRDRITREELIEIIKATEAAGRDSSELRAALDEAFPPVQSRNSRAARNLREEEAEPTAERLDRRVGALFPNGVTEDIMVQLVKIDLQFSLAELRVKCKDAGLSTSGDKKELAAKLLANGRL